MVSRFVGGVVGLIGCGLVIVGFDGKSIFVSVVNFGFIFFRCLGLNWVRCVSFLVV